MSRMSRGFTIIELLVVIAVIGILATITLVGFNRYQANARDSQRSSQATIISEALEKYYAANGEYPGCTTMTNTATYVVDHALEGTDPKVLVTPGAAANQTNSIDFCNNITTSTPTDSFAYVGDGSSSCLTGSSCLSYTLEYKDESTNSIKSITSRHATDILTSGNITNLAASPYSFSKVNLTWDAVSGASSYNIRYSLDSSMGSPTSFTPPASTNAVQVTGLTVGTTYYFQVQPATSGSTGNWSNIASATTYTLDTPDGTAVPDPSAPASQIKLTWSAIANASSYTVIYNSSGTLDGSGVLTSPTTLNNATSPLIVGSLTAGSTRYFQIKANASGYSSGWSSKDSATTTVPVPQNLTATTNSSTQITASWDSVSVATSYTLDYATDSGFTSPTSISGISGTSNAVTSLLQGKTYYFRVFAYVGSTPSLASSSANATTTVNSPGAPGVAASQPGSVRTCAAGAWIKYPAACPNNYYASGWITSTNCPSGTSPVYQMSARYNSPTTKYYTGGTTTSHWYFEAARSGYYTLWAGQYYCQGPNAGSSWGPWSGEVST